MQEIIQDNSIPLLDCPKDYLIGDASGRIMNEYGRYPCKIQCTVFAILARGTAKATINVTQYDFRANDALLLESGSFLLIHEFSDDALVYYVLFSSSFMEKNTFQTRLTANAMHMHSPIVTLTQEQAGIMINTCKLLIDASNCTPSLLNTEKMVNMYNIFQMTFNGFFRAQSDTTLRPQDRKNEIYYEYCNLVLKHYHEWHHVSKYADTMHITLPHLCATIKQVSDKTAGDLIVEAIITDAKAKLKLTNLQVKEIALSLGFDNVAFFNRFFKTHTSVTPKAYRLLV